MKITKKVQCLCCNSVIEESGTCTCGKIVMVEGNIVSNATITEYKDISPRLLNEVA